MIGEVAGAGSAVIVEREGTAVAVVVSPEDVARWLRIELEADWHAIGKLRARNDHLDPDLVSADVAGEIDAVRRERRSAQFQDG